MSSTAQGPSDGPSSPAEQSPSKQSKRPTSLGRHASSWVNRLHRHHDRNKHRSNNDVERPLLSHDDHDEEDEEAQASAAAPSRKERIRSLLATTHHHSKKAAKASRDIISRNAKHILIACLLALLTLLVSIAISFLFHHKSQKTSSICQSAACVHAASEILYNLDPNHAKLDACTRFDRMVCGGWEQRHDLRPDQGDMFTGTIMAENSKTILRHILEQPSSNSLSTPADQDNFNKLKDDYDACMSENALRSIGTKPLDGVLDHIKMSFPVTVDRISKDAFPRLESSFQKGMIFDGSSQLTDTMLFLIKLDITAFLSFWVGVSKPKFLSCSQSIWMPYFLPV
jgi:Peptidase family M13